MALIELSTETPAPPAAASPPPAYCYRRAGLVLAVLLLLALGGAAPAASVLWQRVGAVPVPPQRRLPADRRHPLHDGSGRGAARADRLAGRAGPAALELLGRQRARTRSTWLRRRRTSRVVRSGRSVTVLDARTGAVRWTSAVAVQPVSDTVAFVEEEIFRPGTEYDPAVRRPRPALRHQQRRPCTPSRRCAPSCAASTSAPARGCGR